MQINIKVLWNNSTELGIYDESDTNGRQVRDSAFLDLTPRLGANPADPTILGVYFSK
ncbi:MAG: hypothetical protein ACYCPW_12840 [Nitrososphaerales archaeon]